MGVPSRTVSRVCGITFLKSTESPLGPGGGGVGMLGRAGDTKKLTNATAEFGKPETLLGS